MARIVLAPVNLSLKLVRAFAISLISGYFATE